MGFHQASGNCKAKANTTGGTGPRFVHPVKPLENMGQVFRRDAWPGIFDGHLNLGPGGNGYDDHIAAGWSIFHSIGQQIAQHLADTPGVHKHWELSWRIHPQAHLFGLRLLLHGSGGPACPLRAGRSCR